MRTSASRPSRIWRMIPRCSATRTRTTGVTPRSSGARMTSPRSTGDGTTRCRGVRGRRQSPGRTGRRRADPRTCEPCGPRESSGCRRRGRPQTTRVGTMTATPWRVASLAPGPGFSADGWQLRNSSVSWICHARRRRRMDRAAERQSVVAVVKQSEHQSWNT